MFYYIPNIRKEYFWTSALKLKTGEWDANIIKISNSIIYSFFMLCSRLNKSHSPRVAIMYATELSMKLTAQFILIFWKFPLLHYVTHWFQTWRQANSKRTSDCDFEMSKRINNKRGKYWKTIEKRKTSHWPTFSPFQIPIYFPRNVLKNTSVLIYCVSLNYVCNLMGVKC